jgi:hypothetical protein
MFEGDKKEITQSTIYSSSTIKSGYEIKNLFDYSQITFWQSDSLIPHYICG